MLNYLYSLFYLLPIMKHLIYSINILLKKSNDLHINLRFSLKTTCGNYEEIHS